MIPTRVQDAARRALAERGSQIGEFSLALATGQIVKILSYPDDEGRIIARLGLVVAVDSEDETARFLLATPATESATDLDLIISSFASGLPFDLLVQSELYGTIFDEQAVAKLAVVETDIFAAADAALATDGESLELLLVAPQADRTRLQSDYASQVAIRTGHPLSGSDDPRRSFKERELDDLDSLVRECRRAMDGLAATDGILDVSLLVPPPAGTDPDTAADQFLELLDLVTELGTGRIELPAYWLEEENLIAELNRWQADFGLPASRILDRYVLSADEPIEALQKQQLAPLEIDPQAEADAVMVKALRGKARNGSAVVDIYTTSTSNWHRRHERKFIKEQVGSNAVVRAFPRTLEGTSA